MKLINNQIFYNLENYLDMKSFDEMNDKITYVMAKNYTHFAPSGAGQNTLYDKSAVSMWKKRDQILKEVTSMSKIEAAVYAKLSGTVTLGTNFILRGIKDSVTFDEKHLKENVIVQSFDEQFKFLYDWIDAQNCFSEYGRVLFWVNEPSQKTAFHQDYAENDIEHRHVKDSFIWLTGIIPKRLVAINPTTNETHYSTSRACVFNTHNIHSSEGHPTCAAWSFRVDGTFNKEWANRAGIAEYFNI